MDNSGFTSTPRRKKNPWRKYLILAIAAILVIFLLVFLTAYAPFVTIPASHTGVVTTFGKVEDHTLSEGFNLKNPLQRVILIDNRTQRATIETQAFSSDIQQVQVVCSINYAIRPETCQKLYQRVGTNYYSVVMERRKADGGARHALHADQGTARA